MPSIVATLIWDDEDPEHLYALVESLGGFADGLVALDGAFEGFPGGECASPAAQAEVLADAAFDAGLDLVIYQPRSLWPSEPWKRNAAFNLARRLGPDYPAWVMVVDADYEVRWTEEALTLLGSSIASAATVKVVDAPEVEPRQWCVMPQIFRMTPGLRYHDAHYLVLNEDETLFCPLDQTEMERLGLPPLAEPLDLTSLVEYEHKPKHTFERRQAALDYYAVRDERGIEEVGSLV